MMTKVARAMVPAAPPEVLCCSCACRRVYLSFEQSFLFSVVCKTLNLCYSFSLCPSKGFAIYVSMLRFYSMPLGPNFLRYDSAVTVC